jgi:hypothetical protein
MSSPQSSLVKPSTPDIQQVPHGAPPAKPDIQQLRFEVEYN